MHINKSIVVFFLLLFVSFNALAILPLVAFAPVLEAAVEDIIIDSVANETIATVSTAANDASWFSTFTNWLQAGRAVSRVAIVAGAAGAAATYDIELNPADYGNKPVGTMGTMYSIHTSFGTMGTNQSTDGQIHIAPDTLKNVDIGTAIANFLGWWNSLAVGSWQYSNPQSCAVYGNGRYGCSVDYPGCDACQTIEFDQTPSEQADTIKRVIRQGDYFVADSTDPDWTPTEAAAVNNVSALRFWNPAKSAFIDIVANTGGSTQIDYQEQVDATTVREEAAVLDANNIPQSTAGLTQQGAIASQPSPSSSSSGSSSIQIPTDYNRENTQLEIKDSLNTAPSVNPDLALQKSTLDTNADSHKQAIDDLGNKGQDNEGGVLSWSLPQPVAQDNTCVDPSFDLFSGMTYARTVSFTGFCDSFMKVRALLEWVLYVFTLVYLFRIATMRNEEV